MIAYCFKKYPSLKTDIAALGKQLQLNPQTGIPLGNDCYKIRVAITSKGKGKSGGARVITYVQIIKQQVLLLAIYDKSEAENISDKEMQGRLKKLENFM